jgi:hypothetical protein
MSRYLPVLALALATLAWFGVARRAAGEPVPGGVRVDALRLADGAVHLGSFVAFDGMTVEFRTEGATLRVPRRDVTAILFAPQEVTGTTAPVSANPEAEAAADVGLTGLWNSPEWGTMRLVQKGRRIYGNYDWDGGQIDGYIQGDELRFWWWEQTPLGKSFAEADEGQRGDGCFTIAKDGKSLTGVWRYHSSIKAGTKPTSAWTAQRTGALPEDFAYTPAAFTVPEGATKW